MGGVETVTILFTDLVGSTELSSRVGPERSEVLRHEHFGLLREAVAAAGGREIKNLGDGLMVSFSSAAGAIECAAAMQQRHELRNRKAEEILEVRIGVSMGDATHEEGDWFGPPVVEAARLCAKANGGDVLLPELTRLMVGRRGDHTFAPVGELELKGLPEPVATCKLVWEPIAAARSPLPDRLAAIPQTSFVGRAKERARLSEVWETASRGDRRVILVAGEGGIGKTRLATDLALDAHASGATVLYGHFDDEVGAAYEAWSEALQRLVDNTPTEILQAHVLEYGGDLSRLVVLPLEDVPKSRSSDPETERYLLFRSVGSLLEKASHEEPVLLFLDDLHWADSASLALLKHVISNVINARVLVLCTYRDSDLPTGHPLGSLLADLRRIGGIEWVALEGFEHAEVVALMEAAAGHELDLAGLQLADALANETDGNPFFMREMLLHLVESGGLVQGADGRYVLTAEVGALGLPGGVRDVIGQRVQRLGDRAAEVLRSAAVIGRQFDLELLASVLDMDEDDLLDVVEPAISAAVLRESTEVQGRFIFSHALTNRTLYEELSRTSRANLHHRIAQALEALYGDRLDDRLPELAFHWSEATKGVDVPKAVEYARRAGERELQQLAPNVAIGWFTQGLDQLSALGDGHHQERCELLILLGEAERQAGEPAYRDTLLEASTLAEQIVDPDRMARAVLANTGVYGFTTLGTADAPKVTALRAALAAAPNTSSFRARLLAQLAAELGTDSATDFDEVVRPIVDEALTLARATGDLQVLGQVLEMIAYGRTRPDPKDERRELYAEFIRVATALDDPYLIASASFVNCNTIVEDGDVPAFQECVARMQLASASTGQPRLRYMAAIASVFEAQVMGQLAQAEALAGETLAVGMEMGFPLALTYYGAQLGAICLEQGRLGEVIDLYLQAADTSGIPTLEAIATFYLCELGRAEEASQRIAKAARDDFQLPRDFLYLTGLVRWAESAAIVGDLAAASLLYDRLLPYRDRVVNSAVVIQGSAEMYLGRVAHALGRVDDAIAHLATAVGVHEAMQSPLCLARTCLYQAEALASRGTPEDLRQGRHHLDRALDLAAHHGGVAIQRQCAEAERLWG